MSIILSSRSLARLDGAHPDLRRVVVQAAALSGLDFTVLEVLRSYEAQKRNVASGASKTMKSRHLASADGKSRAVDLAPLEADGKPSWAWPLYYQLADVVKQAAKDCHVPIEWGGDWHDFKDGPHFQLPWKEYP